MNFPRVSVAAGLLIVAALAPGLVPAPKPAPAGTVGMRHEAFATRTVTVPRGGSVVFYNNSGFLHVLGPGDDGRFAAEAGVPRMGDRGAVLSESGARYTVGPWNTPGEYHITCSLHPEMNITILVTG